MKFIIIAITVEGKYDLHPDSGAINIVMMKKFVKKLKLATKLCHKINKQ
jgi:hypothetical protein